MMNSYKNILVQLDTPETAQSVLSTALQVARKFGGHMDVFHVHPEPSCILPVPVVSADMAGFVVNDVVSAEESAFAENADEMRLVFEKFVEERAIQPKTEPFPAVESLTAEFRELYGCEDEVIAWCSRVADLTILPRPDDDPSSPKGSLSAVNAALMESGAAIMLAPMQKPDSVGERVMINWDATEEAAKAVSFAMPFLTTASEVVILETDVPNESWADAEALAKRLAWHGIKAQILKMPELATASAKGDEIIKQAGGRFDLLVTGAFTQSTMRRWILGSTTKYLIDNADIPLFLAH